jgi:hypothetical protein
LQLHHRYDFLKLINKFEKRLRENYGSVYVLTPPSESGGKTWWEGYAGERAVILEEFTGDSMSVHYFKSILEKNSLQRFNVKGNFCF